jgi:hypothetical protein
MEIISLFIISQLSLAGSYLQLAKTFQFSSILGLSDLK